MIFACKPLNSLARENIKFTQCNAHNQTTSWLSMYALPKMVKSRIDEHLEKIRHACIIHTNRSGSGRLCGVEFPITECSRRGCMALFRFLSKFSLSSSWKLSQTAVMVTGKCHTGFGNSNPPCVIRLIHLFISRTSQLSSVAVGCSI